MKPNLPIGMALLIMLLGGSRSQGDAGTAYFETHIRPVLVNHCYECHSGDKPKGGLRLDYRGGWLKGGKSGPALVPRQPEESLIIQYLRHEDVSKRMPKGAPRLPPDMIYNIAGWITKGAPDPRATPPSAHEAAEDSWRAKLADRSKWWSLQPPKPIQPPEVEDEDWRKNPVDRFIYRKLNRVGVSGASPASAEVLLRRLTFVLTGLPPEADKIDSFRKEFFADADRALASLTEELLASPHYGERIARHWMDVVRYTDTYGYEWDPIAVGSWEYRDYLIRAFNNDLGYDQLIREQIAGDLLPRPRINREQQINESLIGPMFYHLGEHRHGASVNFNGVHQEMIDNKIDAFSKTFLAMTVACARCHDHKLDAISQQDYYALAGMFMTPRWTTRPIDSQERNAQHIEELKTLRHEIHHQLIELWQGSTNLSPTALREWAEDNHQQLSAAGPENIGHPLGKLVGEISYDPVRVARAAADNGQLRIEADGKTVLATGNVPATDNYTIEFDSGSGSFSSLQLAALTHPSLGQNGPGRTAHGNFVLSYITVAVTPKGGESRNITLASAEADYNQPNYHVSGALTPKGRGWGVGLGGNVDRWARFGFENVVDLSHGGRWKISLHFGNGSNHILGRLRLALGSTTAGQINDTDIPGIWTRLASDWNKTWTANKKVNVAFKPLTDFSTPGLPAGWVMDGKGMEHGFVQHGTPRISLTNDTLIAELLPAGYHTHALSPKLPGALRIPDPKTFSHTNISIRFAGGDWTSRRIIPQNAFLAEGPKYFDGKAAPAWLQITSGLYRHGVTRYVNEFATANLNANFPGRTGIARFGKMRIADRDEDRNKPSWFSLTGIAGHTPATTPKPTLTEFADLYQADKPTTVDAAWQALSTWLNSAVDRWAQDETSAADVAILNWLHRNRILPTTSPKLSALVARYRAIEQRIEWSRNVNTMDERHLEPVNYRLNIRGDVYQEGDAIRRDFLEVFSGKHRVAQSRGSGRLELAEHLSSSPLAARVFVNRVWHWVFGSGIVSTPSDFGKLGAEPSHPDLLDWLTQAFVRDNWSTKRLIRRLVLSRTFRQSGHGSLAARELDPSNRLLHHYPTRRLEAEAIRDSVLAVSGRLDPKLYGRPINPYRRAEDPKKRLFSGPLDGHGRRALYQEMSIMQPPEFLVGFNLPVMKLPTGKRDVTNVPAQALTMLNHPFVNAMAQHWAEQLTRDAQSDPPTRTRDMIRKAFGRDPSQRELRRWTAAVREFAAGEAELLHDQQAWQALAHALFNTKEFIYYR